MIACAAAESSHPAVSFAKQPFVPPKIVGDLSTWLSDGGDQVVAINLSDSVGSNRYFGEIKTVAGVSGENPYVFTDGDCANASRAACADASPPSFGYRLVGQATNGVYVLFTEESGGGSGRFRNLMFVTLERDMGFDLDENSGVLRLGRERWLIRKLGEVALGDRYAGKITIAGNTVHIEADQRDTPADASAHDRSIRIELPAR